jgi:hypothetical protein
MTITIPPGQWSFDGHIYDPSPNLQSVFHDSGQAVNATLTSNNPSSADAYVTVAFPTNPAFRGEYFNVNLDGFPNWRRVFLAE